MAAGLPGGRCRRRSGHASHAVSSRPRFGQKRGDGRLFFVGRATVRQHGDLLQRIDSLRTSRRRDVVDEPHHVQQRCVVMLGSIVQHLQGRAGISQVAAPRGRYVTERTCIHTAVDRDQQFGLRFGAVATVVQHLARQQGQQVFVVVGPEEVLLHEHQRTANFHVTPCAHSGDIFTEDILYNFSYTYSTCVSSLDANWQDSSE